MSEQQEQTFKIKPIPKPSAKVTLRNYYNAVYAAQDIVNPNRYELLEIYDDITIDPIVLRAMSDRILKITGLQYSLKKSNGSVDEQATELFYRPWFKKVLRVIMEARFFGNSLFEIKIINGEPEIVLVPRANVIPEKKEVKEQPYQYNGYKSYANKNTYPNLVEVNNNYDSRNLGELITVARYILIKNELIINWTQYTEIFGQPLRVATSDTNNKAEFDAIENNLKNMGRSGYIIKNSQTDIKFESASTSTADVFNTLREAVNNEVTITLTGSSVTTQNYSEANSQERGSNLITKDDIQFVTSIVDSYIIPILKSEGLINPKVTSFNSDEPEILTIDEKIKVDSFLLTHFDIEDLTYFEGRYGVAVTPKKETIDESKTEPTDEQSGEEDNQRPE